MGLDLQLISDANATQRPANVGGRTADKEGASRFNDHLKDAVHADASRPDAAGLGTHIPEQFQYLLPGKAGDAPVQVPAEGNATTPLPTTPGKTGKLPIGTIDDARAGLPVQPGKGGKPAIDIATSDPRAGLPVQPGKGGQNLVQNIDQQNTATPVPQVPVKGGAVILPVDIGDGRTPLPLQPGKTGQPVPNGINTGNTDLLAGLPVQTGKQANLPQGTALNLLRHQFRPVEDFRLTPGQAARGGKVGTGSIAGLNLAASGAQTASGQSASHASVTTSTANASAVLQAAGTNVQPTPQPAIAQPLAQAAPGLHTFGFAGFAGFSASNGETSFSSGDGSDAALDGDTATGQSGRATGSEKAVDGTQLRGPLSQQAAGRIGAEAVSRFAARLAARANDGNSKFQMRMDPPSLGKVEVKLEVSADNRVHAMLRMEKPETLHDMQREADSLRKALIAEGYDVPADGLQFSLSDQGGQAWQGFGQENAMPTGSGHLAAKVMASAMQDQGMEVDTGLGFYRMNDSRVDIRA